jgi:hypothetical protein
MKNIFKKSRFIIFPALIVFIMGMIPSVAPVPEEGMYPLSEMNNIDLKKAGLKINPKEIYNPKGVSLIDALVSLGGCTGSFVSPDGLIITNHHCAFGAISAASTPEKNYLHDGFSAKTRAEEIPNRGGICRIMESYEDVSDKILKAVENISDPVERIQAIAKKRKEIADAATDRAKSIEGQVSEMFIGKTYVLFKYKTIRDVRLVYAPPRAIGEFGGETDNWVWPRHTGDFSFLRAYVAPDGSSAAFSKDNVPYKPKKYLKVNPKGAEEGDFLFILGYPGTTYRHRPSQFVDYQYKYQLPYVSDIYEFQINTMIGISKGDAALELKYASRIKGLANTMKNYKGKIEGLRKIQLVEQKKQEEVLMKKFIEGDAKMKKLYGSLFEDLDREYSKLMKIAQASLFYGTGISSSSVLGTAVALADFASEISKPEKDRKAAYKETSLEGTKTALINRAGNFDVKVENPLLLKVLKDALKFEASSRINALYNALGSNTNEQGVENLVNNVLMKSAAADKEKMKELLAKSPAEIANDPIVKFGKEASEQRTYVDGENQKINGNLNKLLAQFVDAKAAFKNKSFIPDANSTLRLTYGHVKGYTPSDATYYKPITTLDGVIEKSYSGGDFVIPEKLKELYDKKDYGPFYSKKAKGLPVAILYDMDTTGGNSGSPILNAYGEIIGVNFDRAYSATINDYAWNESYSRSIGVDMRYVLWVTMKFNEGGFLLKEMGVKL